MRRGEVWWAELPEPAGRRPVLIVTRDVGVAVRAAVTVAPVTRTIRGIPVEVELGAEDGMPRRCVVNCDSLLTVPKGSLRNRIATLIPGKCAPLKRLSRSLWD